MEQMDPPNYAIASPEKNANNRAFPRYPSQITAVLQDGNNNIYACEIRNVCIGGMYIVFTSNKSPSLSTLTHGGIIRVHFSLKNTNSDKNIIFNGRVLRLDSQSIGIAFINPDLTSLQTTIDFAANSITARLADEHAAAPSTPTNHAVANQANVDQTNILEHCQSVIINDISHLLERTFALVASRLFDLSGEAEHFQVASLYYNGSTLIKNISERLTNSYKEKIAYQLSHNTIEETGKDAINDLTNADIELSLVEDTALEDFIAGADTVNTIEIKNKEVLALLTANLSKLHHKKINNENNPYGGKLFVDTFQDVIKTIELDPAIVRICYSTFKELLIEVTGTLYKTINSILADNGIKTDINSLKPKYTTQRRTEISAANQKDAPSLPEKIQTPANTASVANNSHVNPITATTTQPTTTPANELAPSITRKVTPAQPINVHEIPEQVQTPVPQQAASDLQQTNSTPITSPMTEHSTAIQQPPNANVDDENLYKVVGELLELRKALKREKVNTLQGNTQQVNQTPQPIKEQYNTQELIKAIDALQSTAGSNTSDNITHLLTEASAENSPLHNKEICPSDAEVLEVSDELFEAMLYDPCVDDSVKPWIKQLKFPIVKLALFDNSVLADKSHVVRTVIDKISQLEFYKEDKNTNTPNSLKKIIDNLIEKANQDFDGSDQVFHTIDKQLDKLSKIQHQAYIDNIKDVQQACEKKPPIPTEEYTLEQYQWFDDEEWSKWLKIAQRLQKGDWINYKIDETENRKLRLAWVDQGKTLFVFVNYLGLKNITLSVKDLALHLFHQRIILLDSADEPAVDRAQLSMLQKLHGQLLYETSHDQLTDLINRREFERLLGLNIDTAKADGERHAVCFLDIDNFSVINDTCGYAGGDKLLKELAELLKTTLPSNGIVARLGSDEFGILIKNSSLDDALNQAEDLLEAVYNFKFTHDTNSLSVGVSLGLIPINNQTDSPASLLQAAQASSIIAKEAGGNRLQLYHSGLARVTQRNEMLKWVGVIDKMLETDSLLLRCQRIEHIHAKTPALPYYEILLSIIDDNKQILLPKKFIDAAELYHRMADVDRWVIKNTFKQLANQSQMLEQLGGIAIKLSTQALTDDSFIKFIAQELTESRIPADKIYFEITENMGINNLSDTANFIREISATGCKCILDDFGGGASSYRYLKQLPFECIKIDGNFIKNIQISNNDYAVVKSICEVAHFMNKKVIAEFVENEDTLNRLKGIGIDYAQGYFVEEPITLASLLTSHSQH